MDYIYLRLCNLERLSPNMAALCCAYNRVEQIISRGKVELLRHMLIPLKREYLYMASHLKMVKYLMKYLDFYNENDFLRKAAENEHIAVVQFLVASGADIHAEDDLALRKAAEEKMDYLCLRQRLPRNLAALCCAYNRVEQIISRGRVELLRHMQIPLPQQYLYLVSHIKMIQYLAKYLDIHAENDYALKCAAENGHLAVVQFLVASGADIHAENDYALKCAAENGHLAVVQFLVASGADIHAERDFALKCAAENGHLAVVQFLVASGADIHAGRDFALKCAAENDHLAVVQFLIASGADIHADRDCALRWAASNGHLNILKFLVANGADIHVSENYALKWAARCGHLKVVKFLIESGANINIGGAVALTWAAYRGRLEIVKFLVASGADIHADDDCALKSAIEMKHHAVVEFLTTHIKQLSRVLEPN